MNKLRDVSKESDADDTDNVAAEELDADAERTPPSSRGTDGNDADEHDDYEEKEDDYAPVSTKRKGEKSEESGEKLDREDEDWPEILPTPAAQSSDGEWFLVIDMYL